MTHGQDDFTERLRRALHDAADRVEPAGDGLDRIRSRLAGPRPALVAWVMGVYSATARLALGGVQSFTMWVRGLPGAAGKAWSEAPAARWAQAHTAAAAALGVVVLAVAMGIFAATPIGWQTLSGTATSGHSRHAGGNGGRGGGTVDGHGRRPSSGATGTGAASSSPGQSQPTPAPCPTPPASGSPSPGPAQTACASPSPTPVQSVTPTPAASPSQSVSPSPSGTSSPPVNSPSPSETTSPPVSSPSPSETTSPPVSSPSPDVTPVPSGTPSASAPSPPGSVSRQPAGVSLPPITLRAVPGVFPGNTRAVFRALARGREDTPRGKRCHRGRGEYRRDRGRWPLAGHRPGVADPPGRHHDSWGPADAWPHGRAGLRWTRGHLRQWENWPGW